MTYNAKIEWKYKPKELTQKILMNDQTQLYFSNLCKKYMDRYVPFRTGVLKNTARAVKDGVYYNTPYAHRQYSHTEYRHMEGRVGEWDKRMVAVHKQDILISMARYINSQGFK